MNTVTIDPDDYLASVALRKMEFQDLRAAHTEAERESRAEVDKAVTNAYTAGASIAAILRALGTTDRNGVIATLRLAGVYNQGTFGR